MSKSVKFDQLGAVIGEELTVYHRDVLEKINAAGEKAMKALVKRTKATAPKDRGEFSKAITSQTTSDRATGAKTFTWGAKAPHSRLTHLVVNGHATKNGERTNPNPFLQNALDEVLPEYERDVEEAIKG